MTIQVECYAGYKADERPLRFRLGTRWLAIEDILDRWYDPRSVYFKVLAEDGSIYILRHLEPDDTWTLEAYRDPTI